MNFRIILVPLRGTPSDHHLLRIAQTLARRFGAHVAALHIELSDAWVMASLGDGLSERTIRDAFARRNLARRHARAAFDDWLVASQFEEGAARDGAAASFQVVEGFEVRTFPGHARYADLIVLSSPADVGMHRFDLTLETAALLRGGCPALVVPPGAGTCTGRTVAVAWDASAEAARAVRSAMPMLERATQVHVMTAREHGIDEREAETLVDYLAVHGVAATPIGLRPQHGVGPALLKATADAGCDLMVMGAFHHSLLREAILGGTTECALHRAEIPLFLSR
ncbi:universal stress protein [Azospirillum canadense]|uniref:universal stress protein n=1 Tax=Azospirillum canadense TaxID=403962 RepID=UPI0022275FF7|nr:universal stress protein [Azospirillum canadense]MCW2242458.1 nucleotide-binding universal stress UspA family protein [Azospirillum canadense]